MSVRPEFRPTLPEAVRLPRALTAAAVALVVVAGMLVVFTRGGTEGGRSSLAHRGAPAFNLLYDEELVRPARPGPGELARLEARPARAQASVTVRALPDSDLEFVALPLYAERWIVALREEHEGLRLREEGKARIWGHPGYRLEWRAGGISGTDVMLFPDDTALTGGALVSFRRSGRGGGRAVGEVRRVLRSFQFGADRR